MTSRKLEVAGSLVYNTCISMFFKKVFKEFEDAARKHSPPFGKSFWVRIKKEESNTLEQLVSIYVKFYTLKELEDTYDKLQTASGKALFRKTMRIGKESQKIGMYFSTAIQNIVDEEEDKLHDLEYIKRTNGKIKQSDGAKRI